MEFLRDEWKLKAQKLLGVQNGVFKGWVKIKGAKIKAAKGMWNTSGLGVGIRYVATPFILVDTFQYKNLLLICVSAILKSTPAGTVQTD